MLRADSASSPDQAAGRVACACIEDVDKRWRDLRYMRLEQARFLRSFFHDHGIERVLELGFYKGKSTAFMASILEERGSGHIVTMDVKAAKQRKPAIAEVLQQSGLQHRVTPVYAHRSFTWELCKLLERSPRPQFDFCYFDGAHTWDGTGFAFMLVDLLLKPGGWALFDDLDWSINTSAGARRDPKPFEAYDDEEKTARQVRKVWEVLVPARGYKNMREERRFGWGLAQKP